MITQMDKIIHLDELPCEDFIKFLENFESAKGAEELEISEKIDGQNCSFGLDKDDTLFVKTKKSKPIYGLEFYEEVKFLGGFQKFHHILLENLTALPKIKNLVPLITKTNKDFTFQIFGELIPEAHTNTIAYDESKIKNGTLVVFDFKVDGESILESLKRPVIIYMISALNKVYNWNFIYKPMITLDNFILEKDIISDYEKFYIESRDFISARKKVEYSEAGFDVDQSNWLEKSRFLKRKLREVLTQKRVAIKKIFLDSLLENRSSVIGDSKPEGIIFRDSKNNLLVKLVDKDDFVEANKVTHKFSSAIRDLSRETNKAIKHEIFNNADVLKNYKKVLEKISDDFVTKKQSSRNFQYNNIDELLLVIYNDMIEENRITLSHEEIVEQMTCLIKDKLQLVKQIQKTWDSSRKTHLSNNTIKITNNFIDEFKKNAEELIVEVMLSKSIEKASLSMLYYLFGQKKINELDEKFIMV